MARSGFLPRWLGILLSTGGASYVVSSIINMGAPDIGARIAPFILFVALLGEGSVTLWLLIRGVDETQWFDRNRTRTPALAPAA
jgi:hypothetical protein